MAELRLARGFGLPVDVLGEALGIVATRGAGKSYTSAVVLEETHAVGVPFVVLDPSGAYWGLRSSADGEKAGLPIYVLGGEHGDLPLDHAAGAFIADVVVESGHSFVLDLSDMTAGKMRQFAADFLERLYERKARDTSTLLLVVDEADEFAPQKPRGETARSLGAMERIAKRGRRRGLGIIVITQRTQSLNKDVLDLIETLIVLRQLAERSREAVKGWIADKELRDEAGVIESLQSLPTGTAWVWSPLRGILHKVAIRRIRTFDSYATPKPGEVRPEPRRRAELDLEALGERMRSTVEKVKADDPADLRRRLAEVQRELDAQKIATDTLARRSADLERFIENHPPTEPVEVPMFSPDEFDSLDVAVRALDGVPEVLAQTRETLAQLTEIAALRARVTLGSDTSYQTADPATPPPPVAPVPAPAPVKPAEPTWQDGELTAAARRFLETLGRHHPVKLSISQMAVLAGRKPRGGSFNSAMRILRDGGYLEEDGSTIGLSPLGVTTAGVAVGQRHSPEETRTQWREALPSAARDLYDVLVSRYPNTLTPDDLAVATGRQPRGGSWNSAVKTIVSNNLATKSAAGLRASDFLFS